MNKQQDRVMKGAYELRVKLQKAIECPSNREGVSLDLLKSMLARIEAIVSEEKFSPSLAKGRLLSRIIMDTWPLGTKLGNEISEWETLYVNL